MKSRTHLLLTAGSAALLLHLAGPLTAQAQTVITQWNFNSPTGDANTATGTTTPSTGAGMLTLIGGTTSTFSAGSPGDANTTDNSGLNTTAYPAQGTNSGTAGVQYAVSTLGFSNLTLSLDFRQSGTASRYFQLQLSTDGVTFTNASGGTAAIVGTIGAGNTGTSFSNTGIYANNPGGGTQTFVQGITYTLAPGSPYQNDANFAFRWVSIFDPTGANGNNYLSANAGTTAAYSTTGTARFDLVTISGVPEPSTWALTIVGALGALFVARRRVAVLRA